MEEIELYLDDAKDTMEGAIKHLLLNWAKYAPEKHLLKCWKVFRLNITAQ